jgi:hypothetical protein
MGTKLNFRWFSEFEDYPVFSEWCAGHGIAPLELEFLPDTGIVISQGDAPVAMVWIYFDDSTPVCFAERAITRPGLRLAETVASLSLADKTAKEIALTRGSKLMMLRAPKGIARYAVSIGGFEIEEHEVVNLCFRLVREEDLCPG